MIGDAQVTAAIEPHPTSKASSLTPVRSTIALAAGPTLVVIKSNINLIPAKPIPNVKPDLKAREIFNPKNQTNNRDDDWQHNCWSSVNKEVKDVHNDFHFSAPLISYYFSKFKISSIV